MRRKTYLKILIWIVTILLSVILFTRVVIEPWVGRRIQTALNGKIKEYQIEIKRVRISIFSKSIDLKTIKVYSNIDKTGLTGEIAFIKLSGVNFIKALLKKDINILEVTISQPTITGNVQLKKKSKPLIIIPQNISIGQLNIYKTNVSVGNTSNAQLFSVIDGNLKLYNLQINKSDTLSLSLIKVFDFEASELSSTSSDSMYTFIAKDFVCSAVSNTLASGSFSVHPNYSDYDFTSRYKYQKDRIEADFSNIYIHDINPVEYLKSGSITSSFLEIGNMDMKVFRDKRKEFRHIRKKTFQELIYSYPSLLNIDSIRLMNGSIRYAEHVPKANNPGSINFEKIQAKIYKITNNSIYKTRQASAILKCDALFMGKGRLSILQKWVIFDHKDTFTLEGTLTDMEANEMNSFLEKNAFIYITSGKVDVIKFNFKATDSRAIGTLRMLYHGLSITVKNKRTDDTTAFKEKFISMIANSKVIDSNPEPGEGTRVGIIDYERDPERFLFGYWVKSVASGIKSILVKSQKK